MWLTRASSKYAKSPHHVQMTNNSQRKNQKRLENYPTSSQIVMKCLYSARIGRLDILWSVNYLAGAITKWNKACDKRLARLIPQIYVSTGSRPYRHVGDNRIGVQVVFFFSKTPTWQATWRTPNHRQEVCCASWKATHLRRLDGLVKKADSCFTQQYWSRDNLSRRWSKIGRNSCAQIVGYGDRCVGASSWEKSHAQQIKQGEVTQREE